MNEKEIIKEQVELIMAAIKKSNICIESMYIALIIANEKLERELEQK